MQTELASGFSGSQFSVMRRQKRYSLTFLADFSIVNDSVPQQCKREEGWKQDG